MASKTKNADIRPNTRGGAVPVPAVVANIARTQAVQLKPGSGTAKTAIKTDKRRETDELKPQIVKRTDFIVSFAWLETPEADRK